MRNHTACFTGHRKIPFIQIHTIKKNLKKVIVSLIEQGLIIERFYIADVSGDIAGVMAISDCNGRAASINKQALRKNFGLFTGLIGAFILKEEFEGKLDYPITTGYLEFVTVRKKYRKQGIATTMIKESIQGFSKTAEMGGTHAGDLLVGTGLLQPCRR